MKITFAALALASMTVSAAANPAQQSVVVKADDLDLGSDKGQQIITLRIHRAARALCESQAMAGVPQNMRAERKCIREAKFSAMAAAQALHAALNQSQKRLSTPVLKSLRTGM